MQSARPSRYTPRSRATYDTANNGLPSGVRSTNISSGLARESYRRGTVDDRVYSDVDTVSASSLSSSSSSLRTRSNQSTPRSSVDSNDYDTKQSVSNTDEHSAAFAQEANQEGGSWFWSKVSNLTVSVGKAWSAESDIVDGEATPVGEESRLTKAMKCYHLAKATHPSELPEWLFSQQERFPGRSRPGAEPTICEEPSEVSTPTPQQIPRSRPPHNDAPSGPPPRVVQSYTFDEESAAPSRATNRLRAMRDAKRQASSVSTTRIDHEGSTAQDQRGWTYKSEGAPTQERSVPRLGLPNNPARMGRL